MVITWRLTPGTDLVITGPENEWLSCLPFTCCIGPSGVCCVAPAHSTSRCQVNYLPFTLKASFFSCRFFPPHRLSIDLSPIFFLSSFFPPSFSPFSPVCSVFCIFPLKCKLDIYSFSGSFFSNLAGSLPYYAASRWILCSD